jgi:hypothetical protein
MEEQVSDRQWCDILGVLAVQGEGLDVGYMRQMAAGLEVSDLLERVLVKASPFRGKGRGG